MGVIAGRSRGGKKTKNGRNKHENQVEEAEPHQPGDLRDNENDDGDDDDDDEAQQRRQRLLGFETLPPLRAAAKDNKSSEGASVPLKNPPTTAAPAATAGLLVPTTSTSTSTTSEARRWAEAEVAATPAAAAAAQYTTEERRTAPPEDGSDEEEFVECYMSPPDDDEEEEWEVDEEEAATLTSPPEHTAVAAASSSPAGAVAALKERRRPADAFATCEAAASRDDEPDSPDHTSAALKRAVADKVQAAMEGGVAAGWEAALSSAPTTTATKGAFKDALAQMVMAMTRVVTIAVEEAFEEDVSPSTEEEAPPERNVLPDSEKKPPALKDPVAENARALEENPPQTNARTRNPGPVQHLATQPGGRQVGTDAAKSSLDGSEVSKPSKQTTMVLPQQTTVYSFSRGTKTSRHLTSRFFKSPVVPPTGRAASGGGEGHPASTPRKAAATHHPHGERHDPDPDPDHGGGSSFDKDDAEFPPQDDSPAASPASSAAAATVDMSDERGEAGAESQALIADPTEAPIDSPMTMDDDTNSDDDKADETVTANNEKANVNDGGWVTGSWGKLNDGSWVTGSGRISRRPDLFGDMVESDRVVDAETRHPGPKSCPKPAATKGPPPPPPPPLLPPPTPAGERRAYVQKSNRQFCASTIVLDVSSSGKIRQVCCAICRCPYRLRSSTYFRVRHSLTQTCLSARVGRLLRGDAAGGASSAVDADDDYMLLPSSLVMDTSKSYCDDHFFAPTRGMGPKVRVCRHCREPVPGKEKAHYLLHLADFCLGVATVVPDLVDALRTAVLPERPGGGPPPRRSCERIVDRPTDGGDGRGAQTPSRSDAPDNQHDDVDDDDDDDDDDAPHANPPPAAAPIKKSKKRGREEEESLEPVDLPFGRNSQANREFVISSYDAAPSVPGEYPASICKMCGESVQHQSRWGEHHALNYSCLAARIGRLAGEEVGGTGPTRATAIATAAACAKMRAPDVAEDYYDVRYFPPTDAMGPRARVCRNCRKPVMRAKKNGAKEYLKHLSSCIGVATVVGDLVEALREAVPVPATSSEGRALPLPPAAVGASPGSKRRRAKRRS